MPISYYREKYRQMIGEQGLNAHERQAFVSDGHLVHQRAVSGEILADLLELAEECQRYNDPFYSEPTSDQQFLCCNNRLPAACRAFRHAWFLDLANAASYLFITFRQQRT